MSMILLSCFISICGGSFNHAVQNHMQNFLHETWFQKFDIPQMIFLNGNYNNCLVRYQNSITCLFVTLNYLIIFLRTQYHYIVHFDLKYHSGIIGIICKVLENHFYNPVLKVTSYDFWPTSLHTKNKR